MFCCWSNIIWHCVYSSLATFTLIFPHLLSSLSFYTPCQILLSIFSNFLLIRRLKPHQHHIIITSILPNEKKYLTSWHWSRYFALVEFHLVSLAKNLGILFLVASQKLTLPFIHVKREKKSPIFGWKGNHSLNWRLSVRLPFPIVNK